MKVDCRFENLELVGTHGCILIVQSLIVSRRYLIAAISGVQ